MTPHGLKRGACAIAAENSATGRAGSGTSWVMVGKVRSMVNIATVSGERLPAGSTATAVNVSVPS